MNQRHDQEAAASPTAQYWAIEQEYLADQLWLNPTVHFPEIYGNPPTLPCLGGYRENLSDGTPEEAAQWPTKNGDQRKNGDH